jgi:hypothetical protein
MREPGILREEAISGVDGVCPSLGGRTQDGVLVEVGDGRRGIESPGIVGQAHVEGVLFSVAVDSNRAQAKLACSADDPDGDFAAIGNKQGAQFCAWGGIKHERDDNRVQRTARYPPWVQTSGI